MTEEEIKTILKFAVDNSNKPLNNIQKNFLKEGIDHIETYDDVLKMLLTFLSM